MTFGSLFSGIGGIDLGFERAGLICKWQVEHDDYALRILEKHWPNVARYRDVRYFLGSKRWRRVRAAWHVDVICGGFPCQDISNAGKRAGITGSRSGLWSEYVRIIRLVQPRFVVVENVAALLSNGFGVVQSDLAAIGYDAEWDCISAESVGAPHERDRVFVVAHLAGGDDPRRGHHGGDEPVATLAGSVQIEAADIDGEQRGARRARGFAGDTSQPAEQAHGQEVRDVDGKGSPLRSCFGEDAREELQAAQRANCTGDGHWAAEPDVVRMVHGVPDRVDRIRGLGNAVVPQVAEFIGKQLLESINAR